MIVNHHHHHHREKKSENRLKHEKRMTWNFFLFGYKTFPNIIIIMIMKRERQWNKKKFTKMKQKRTIQLESYCVKLGYLLACSIQIFCVCVWNNHPKKKFEFFFSLNSIESNRIDDKKTHTHTHTMVNGLAIFIHITLPMNFWNIMIKWYDAKHYIICT